MVHWTEIIFILVAYLLGSVPNAVWIGKLFYNIDVREFGSGNAGATNTFRVLGKRAGIPVLILDVLKGFLAVLFAYFSGFKPGSEPFVNFQLVLGVAALLGHIFPLFVGFRGGKGVATYIGVVSGLFWPAGVFFCAVWLCVAGLTRYSSLSALAAAALTPVFVWSAASPKLWLFMLALSALLIARHHKNISNLISGNESKIGQRTG